MANQMLELARGAVDAAEWVRGRRGMFTMDDYLADRFGGPGTDDGESL